VHASPLGRRDAVTHAPAALMRSCLDRSRGEAGRSFGCAVGRHGTRVVVELLAIAVLIGVGPLRTMADVPQLVLDINATPLAASSNPVSVSSIGGYFAFGATDATGAGLWRTDGTLGGTSLVARFGGAGVQNYNLTPSAIMFGASLYFLAQNRPSAAPALWRTDGTTAGTTSVADFASPNGGPPQIMGVLGANLVFAAGDANGNYQLFVTDGTTVGTTPLTTFSGNVAGVRSSYWIFVGQKLYFVAEDNNYAGQLWVTDGTVPGTKQVNNPFGSNNSVSMSAVYNPRFFRLVGSTVLYTSDGLIWTIDTATDTIGAVTTAAGQAGFGPPNVQESGGLIDLNGFVLFINNTPYYNNLQLWRTDGTTAGTYEVGVITPGEPSFDESQSPVFEQVGSRAVYIADDGVHGPQLWGSDGTVANTLLLTNATQPANTGLPIAIPIAVIANTAYFSISNGINTNTWSVWRTDGTPAGTMPAAGLPDFDASDVGTVRMAGDATRVFATITTAVGGPAALFNYNPVTNSAVALKSGMQLNESDEYYYDGGVLYFSENDPVIGDEPWISDGTAAGTHLLKNINPEMANNGSNPQQFVAQNGVLVFAADDGVHGQELWTSDGTAAGTQLLVDIAPGATASKPNHLFVANGDLYFFATDASGNSKFMRLPAGTTTPLSLGKLAPQPTGPFAACFEDSAVVLNGIVYFAADDGSSGLELWRSDGTEAGTVRVADIYPGALGSNPCWLTIFNNKIYFSATGASSGNELWVSDGSAAGTQQVKDIAPGLVGSAPNALIVINNTLYFNADDVTHGAELWQSDGTGAGTKMVADIVPGSGSSFAAALGATNGHVLIETFIQPQAGGVPQAQLWVLNGDAPPVRLGEVQLDASVNPIVNGNLLYFSGTNAAGTQPWISDGTSAGTQVLAGYSSSSGARVAWFANFNGVTVFAVSGSSAGAQLWRTNGTTAGTALAGPIPPPPAAALPPIGAQQLAAGHTFYFAASDPLLGTELYGLTHDPPHAANDSATSTNDAPVTIKVLANDSAPDGTLDTSSVRIATNPQHGAVSVNGDGTVAYTPTPGFGGSDSFVYTVNDNQGAISNPATVTVSVTSSAVTPTSSGGGGGGGGGILSWLELVGLLSIGTLRCAGSRPARLRRLA
jgi:large repetitive protein